MILVTHYSVFKKPNPPRGGNLNDRIRQIADRKPASIAERTIPPATRLRAERQPLFRQGVVVFDDGQRLRVAVKNLSATGARIEFFTNTLLPQEVLVCEPTLKLRRRARVVWQGDGVAGVAFLD